MLILNSVKARIGDLLSRFIYFDHRHPMMDIQALCQRRLFIALFWGGISALACMLALQYTQQTMPCPLCIMQRYAYICIALWSGLGWASLFVPFFTLRQVIVRLLQMLILCTSLAGMTAAGRQWWISHRSTSLNCTFDALEPIMNHFLPATLLPFVFKAGGSCEEADTSLLGVTLPIWSFLGLFAVAVWVLYAMWGSRKQ